MSEARESELKIGYYKIWISRLFFQKFFSKFFILKPIFYIKPIKFGKILIYYLDILYEIWHILKENHETKMSKITHSAGAVMTQMPTDDIAAIETLETTDRPSHMYML